MKRKIKKEPISIQPIRFAVTIKASLIRLTVYNHLKK